MKPRILFTVIGLSLAALPASSENRSPAASALASKVFSVNVNGATAENVVKMIGQKVGAQVQIEGDLSKRVSYSFANTTLENALKRMASDVGFDYSLRNETLYVSKRGGKSSGGAQSVKLIELKFVEAEEMAAKLKSVLGTGEEVHADKNLNALIVVGSEASYRKALEFVAIVDRLPQQIMIEAKIVETNDNFSRELGFQVGDLSDPTMNNNSKVTGLATPIVTSTSPTLRGKYRIGVLDNRALDLRLIAAESKGDAKIVSRPKVVTINNTRALINSGLVFNVKTLSNVAASSGDSGDGTAGGSVVTGGIERVEAGLQLGVLPTIVDKSMVRLLVDVNKSEPDATISIDGIPGISTNSANTSIIVENGNTAVIAGLIKQSKTNGRSGVPFLSDIPILGMLFRTDVNSDRNNELVILITPRILANPGEIEREVAAADTNK